MKELKVGDVVILKSEMNYDFQLLMTVDEIVDDQIYCMWRTKDNVFQRQLFHKGTLIKAEEEE